MGEVRKRTTLGRRLVAVAGSVAVAALGLVGGASAAFADDDVELGNIDFDADASITIHKLTQGVLDKGSNTGAYIAPEDLPAGAVPVKGVGFEVTHLDELDLEDWQVWENLKGYGNDPEQALKDWASGTADSWSGTTDAAGEIVFGGLKPGVYYVEETTTADASVGGNPVSVNITSNPWLVVIPTAVNNVWNYNIHAYPKNVVDALQKTAQELPNGVGIGTAVPWDITATVPKLTVDQEFKAFEVVDTLDPRLEFTKIDNVTFEGAALDSKYWAVKQETVGTGADESTKVTFYLTAEGLAAVKSLAGQKLAFTIHTKVVSLGDGSISNEATSFSNVDDVIEEIVTPGLVPGGTDPGSKPGGEGGEGGEDGTTPPGRATVNYGALKIQKIDPEDNPLAGAVFKVYNSEQNAKDDENAIKVNDSDEFTSSTTDGIATVAGLYVGVNGAVQRDYWIMEVTAPAGFIPIKAPQKVTVKTGSLAQAVVVDVENTPHNGGEGGTLPSLPLTGASGTALFMIAGLVLVGGGVALRMRARSANRG